MTAARHQWRIYRRKMSERAASLIPTTVTEYPFESFVTVLGIILGAPLLAGLARPHSLALLLPPVAYIAYGIALVLGAITVGVALRFKRHPVGLNSGLQLLGGAFVIYSVALVAVAGWAASWLAFITFLFLGAVCLIRALHFRRIVEIQRGARRLDRRS